MQLINYQIYASILDWKPGAHDATDFTANRFVSAYYVHMDILAGIKKRNPRGYETMMATLYDLAKYFSLYLSIACVHSQH
jgi:hypothetical protein